MCAAHGAYCGVSCVCAVHFLLSLQQGESVFAHHHVAVVGFLLLFKFYGVIVFAVNLLLFIRKLIAFQLGCEIVVPPFGD